MILLDIFFCLKFNETNFQVLIALKLLGVKLSVGTFWNPFKMYYKIDSLFVCLFHSIKQCWRYCWSKSPSIIAHKENFDLWYLVHFFTTWNKQRLYFLVHIEKISFKILSSPSNSKQFVHYEECENWMVQQVTRSL